MIFKRKKKELTPDQYRTRFYFAAGLVLVMVVVCILPKKQRIIGPPEGSPAGVMFSTIDSLLLDKYGPGAKLESAELVERHAVPSEDRRKLNALRAELEMLTSLSESGSMVPAEKIDKLRLEIDGIERALSEGAGMDTVFVRRIHVALPDGRTMTGFQKLDASLKHSSLESMMEAVPDDALNEEIQKYLKNQNE